MLNSRKLYLPGGGASARKEGAGLEMGWTTLQERRRNLPPAGSRRKFLFATVILYRPNAYVCCVVHTDAVTEQSSGQNLARIVATKRAIIMLLKKVARRCKVFYRSITPNAFQKYDFRPQVDIVID